MTSQDQLAGVCYHALVASPTIITSITHIHVENCIETWVKGLSIFGRQIESIETGQSISESSHSLFISSFPHYFTKVLLFHASQFQHHLLPISLKGTSQAGQKTTTACSPTCKPRTCSTKKCTLFTLSALYSKITQHKNERKNLPIPRSLQQCHQQYLQSNPQYL